MSTESDQNKRISALRGSLQLLRCYGIGIEKSYEDLQSTHRLVDEQPSPEDWQFAMSKDSLPSDFYGNEWKHCLRHARDALRDWWSQWGVADEALYEIPRELVDNQNLPELDRWSCKLRKLLNDLAKWCYWTKNQGKKHDVLVDLFFRLAVEDRAIPKDWVTQLERLGQYDEELLAVQNNLGVRPRPKEGADAIIESVESVPLPNAPIGGSASDVEGSAVLYQFKRDGAVFDVRFEGECGKILVGSMGAKCVHKLLDSPNKPIDACVLRSAVKLQNTSESDKADTKEALSYCRARLMEIDNDLAASDLPRLDREELVEERGKIITEIRRRTGLGGNPRASMSESDRVAVRRCLVRLYKNCREKYGMPKLAAHLEIHFKTESNSYVYRPSGDSAPDWIL